MQPQQTDLTKIDNIQELEALAYQQIKILNQAQTNIQIIEQRINQLQEAPKDEPKPETKK